PAPAPAPAPAPVPAGGPRVGIVVGSAIAWQLQFVKKLGARSARMEFAIGTPVSEMAPIIQAYAEAGIEANLLAGFPGRIPTAAEVANLANWAAAFGPGGTHWAGKGLPASLAVDRIEFGNESSGPWQYRELDGVADWSHSAQYAAIAEGYGRTFRSAATALRSANPGVRLLAVADAPGRWQQWLDGVFRGAPDLASHVGGWVVHPYGPQWAYNVDDALAQLRAKGASDAIPLYVTETGLATDDGACLDDNYGWDRCLTYAQAASTLTTAVEGIASRYANRLAEIDIYSTSDLRGHGESGAREDYFGALTSGNDTKGAFTTAVQALLARSS
ncbi:MAG: hypothetical protein JWO90_2177, partial [Solirubrobacterales bacterium]|nr:hypothetical protein [Solirubrobacterales bacterium]